MNIFIHFRCFLTSCSSAIFQACLLYTSRNFSPAPRAYGYKELHPEWKDLAYWQQKAESFDSLYMDSIRRVEGLYVLDEVEIKSKRRQGSNMATKISEKSIDAYYDVRRSVDVLRDNGKIVTTIPEDVYKRQSR